MKEYEGTTMVRCGNLSKSADNMQEHTILQMRSEYLTMMLLGQIDNELDFRQLCAECALPFEAPMYAVVLIHVDDYGTELIPEMAVKTEEDYRRARFAISNIFDELVRQELSGFCTVMGRDVVYVVNSFLSSQSLQECLRTRGMQMATVLQEELLMSLTVAVSAGHVGFEQIGQCYQEARQILEYRLIMGMESGVATLQEMESAPYDQELPPTTYFDDEQKLVTCIRHQDYVAAKEQMHNMIKKQLRSTGRSIQATALQYYGLLNTIIQAATLLEQEAYGNVLDGLDLSLFSSPLLSGEKLMEQMDAVFDAIIAVDRNVDHNDVPAWLLHARAYLDAHYQEDINVSALGERVDVGAFYMSKLFKQFYGVSVLDYIHRKRIDEAISLISQGESVKTAAEKVGYASVVTMNRAFRKYTGTTPGKFGSGA